MPVSRDQSGGWRSRDILRILAIVTGFYIVIQLLWVGRSVVLVTFLGVLFGIALAAGVDWLERRRVPRGLGAVLLVLAFLGVLGGLGALTAPSITSQLRELKTQLPAAVGKIQGWIQDRQAGVNQILQQVTPPQGAPDQGQASDQAPGQANQNQDQKRERENQSQDREARQPSGDDQQREEQNGPSLGQGITEQLGGIGRYLFGIFSSTLAVLGGIILILFVAIFVAIDASTYQSGLMHLFPHRMRPRVGEVLSATATMLRRWLLAQLVSMVVIGVLTTVVLWALGIQAAIALGIIAGILEFIPIAGPILSAVPAIAMGFLDGPQKAIYVTLAYIVIQQIEANIVHPLVMKKGLEIPPVLTIVTQAVLSVVFGFLGLLVAVPMLAATIVPIKMLYVRDVVGDEVKLPGDAEEDGKEEQDGKEKDRKNSKAIRGER